MGSDHLLEPATATAPGRGSYLTAVIVVALVLGVAAGWVSHEFFPQSSARFADAISLLPTVAQKS